MTRFATNATALEQDGAMIDYRERAAKDPLFDPAEWIEALHREHWKILELLAQSEGERVVHLKADLRLILNEAKRVENVLARLRSRMDDVLGDTPVVQGLRETGRDLRRISGSLEHLLGEGVV